uniref:Uncharacterized protein n=1 Tax=Tanacetum cinerariifolium TaxID=118510 RepID=A0A6L2J4P1_TANCI|nr:hypothetical protein [Tanacetum cinerariifolium]
MSTKSRGSSASNHSIPSSSLLGVALLLGMYRDGVDRTVDIGISVEWMVRDQIVGLKPIIMVNVFLPDHVDDLPDPALDIPEHALVDENVKPHEAIDVSIEVEESPSSEPRGSPRDS